MQFYEYMIGKGNFLPSIKSHYLIELFESILMLFQFEYSDTFIRYILVK